MKRTKTKLVSSIVTLLICFAMLIGSTFAWFTDSASTGVNTIQAGNLDIEVSYKKPDGSYASIQDATTLFGSDLWEPGHTEYVTLKVENKGTLALKYKVMVTPVSENGGINVYDKNFKLSDYLVFGTTEKANSAPNYTRDEARAAVGETKGLTDANVLTKTYEMAKDAAPQYITLVVYMPETVNNKANAKPGTTAPSIDLGIKVVATQLENESDSFGTDYDAGAVNDPDSDYIAGPYYEYFEAVNASATADQNGNFVVTKQDNNTGVIAQATGTAAVGSEVNLIVTKTSTPSGNFGISVDPGHELNCYDIKVTGQETDSLVQGKLYVGTGLENFVFYHNGSPMQPGTQGNLSGGEYCYNKDDGYVYFATITFSPFQATYVAPEAAIGSAAYGTIENAVSAAKAGDVVTLLKDVEIESQITLPNSVTLDGRYHVIKANNDSWSTNNSSKMLLLISTSDIVKNITLDSNSQTCGVQAYVASDVKLENVTLINSKNAGLLINASQVAVSGTLTMNGNKWGEKDANYINLGWGSGVIADKATLTFAENASVEGVSMVWTDSGDLSNARVSQDDWSDKFAVNGVFAPSKANGGIAFVEPVASIGENLYSSLEYAIDAVPVNGETVTINVLKDIPDAEGMSVPSGKNFVVDFNGNTYTIVGPGAGSANTETNGFQFLRNSTITLKNGKINLSKRNSDVYRVIQNYANLTLEDLEIDATNQYYYKDYVIAFNCGTNKIVGNTSIYTNASSFNPDTSVIFAVDDWADGGYHGANLTIDTTGDIRGVVEVNLAEPGDTCGSYFKLTNGNVNKVSIIGGVVNNLNEINCNNISISGGQFSTNPSQYVAEYYTAVANEENTSWTVRKMTNEELANAGYVAYYKNFYSEATNYYKNLKDGFADTSSLHLIKDVNEDITRNGMIDLYCDEQTFTGSLYCPGKSLYINSGNATLKNIECKTFNGGYSSYDANVTVKNGTAVNIVVAKNANVIIEDGTYTGTITLKTGGDGSLTIKGGTFSSNPSTYVPNEGYSIVDNGDGTWTVTVDSIATNE